MKYPIKASILSAICAFSVSTGLSAQIGSSVAIPGGGGAVQTDPPESKVKVVPKDERKANRAAAKARKDKENCMPTVTIAPGSTDSAIASNNCPPGARRNKPAVQPTVPPAQKSQMPVNPDIDAGSVTGR